MFNALIVDDESDARGVLRGMLELFCPEVTHAEEAATMEQAMTLAKRTSFDLAFLDIELRRESGIDLAKKLRPYCANIIFVTAYDNFALEAFRTEALHYILKPIDPELLKEVIERVKAKNPEKAATITLTTKTEILKLPQQDILYLKGDGNYSTFHCVQECTFMVSRNLAYYLSLLDPTEFIRIHQSYAVRISAVTQYLAEDGFFAVLKNGKKLPIARRRKDAFLKALQGE